ncbi:adenylosuccinate synthase [Sesbania bispinosa]|nr:adenylosuccinate synthase [Sesbania bispinosa]
MYKQWDGTEMETMPPGTSSYDRLRPRWESLQRWPWPWPMRFSRAGSPSISP